MVRKMCEGSRRGVVKNLGELSIFVIYLVRRSTKSFDIGVRNKTSLINQNIQKCSAVNE